MRPPSRRRPPCGLRLMQISNTHIFHGSFYSPPFPCVRVANRSFPLGWILGHARSLYMLAGFRSSALRSGSCSLLYTYVGNRYEELAMVMINVHIHWSSLRDGAEGPAPRPSQCLSYPPACSRDWTERVCVRAAACLRPSVRVALCERSAPPVLAGTSRSVLFDGGGGAVPRGDQISPRWERTHTTWTARHQRASVAPRRWRRAERPRGRGSRRGASRGGPLAVTLWGAEIDSIEPICLPGPPRGRAVARAAAQSGLLAAATRRLRCATVGPSPLQEDVGRCARALRGAR